MADQDNILQFLAVNGPSLPTKVAKLIRSEIIIASAHLSDLASQGKVKISDLKVGGSPLYYLPGQESLLLNFAQSNMNPQDYRVLLALQDNKVLRENEIELLYKVALRSLKDFAFPLHVTHQNKTELFWKWFLLSEQETNQIIREMLIGKHVEENKSILTSTEPHPIDQLEKFISPVNLNPTNPLQVSTEEIKKEDNILRVKEAVAVKETIAVKPEIKEEKIIKKKIIHPKESVKEFTREPIKEEVIQRLPVKEVIKETIKEKNKETPKEIIKEPIKEIIKEEEQKKLASVSESNDKKSKIALLEKQVKKKVIVSDDFILVVEEYFKGKKIVIEQSEILRKNAEIDFIIKVPSVVGHLTYFCKAKNKAKCDEKDLSSAYMEAQIKKLPLLLLYSNEFTKKAQEMLDTGAFENAIVKKIE
jgi:hypothetical protein